MAKGHFPIDKLERLRTPFYYYDMDLLHSTLDAINQQIDNVKDDR